MASTRNRNTPGDYNLQQRNYNLSQNYTLYPNSQYGAAYNTQLAGNGLLAGQIPGNQLSKNTSDIESFLFGINSTNLVAPAPCFYPQLTDHTSFNIYKNEATLMPTPLKMTQERPFPVPN
jgi:hypothetical protein